MNTKLNAQIDNKLAEALSSDYLTLALESCSGRTLVCHRGIKTKTSPAPGHRLGRSIARYSWPGTEMKGTVCIHTVSGAAPGS